MLNFGDEPDLEKLQKNLLVKTKIMLVMFASGWCQWNTYRKSHSVSQMGMSLIMLGDLESFDLVYSLIWI